MKDKDFPGLFQTADAGAATAQVHHLRLSILELALLLSAAVAGSLPAWALASPRIDVWAVVATLALVGTLLTGLLARTRKYAQRWFASRAVAESVRTESWKFMMKVGIYAADERTAEKTFVSQLSAVLKTQPEAHALLAEHAADAKWVTPEMRKTRELSLGDRRTLYCRERLEAQRNWYRRRAARDADQESLWFWGTTSATGLAIVLAVLSVIGLFPIGTIGILTTAATGFIAWSELRDYRVQAQSYAMIHQELSALAALAELPSAEFDVLVDEVERTISREHTLWVSRRAAAASR